MSGIRIAHVINPVKVGEDRDLYFQQPITFESMRIARKSTNNSVNLYAVCYEEDFGIVGDYYKSKIHEIEKPLERSTEGKFKVNRKLPYFKEILDRVYEVSDADYFIQTNADIGLQPYFYDLVSDMIKSGIESFCINKRIVPETVKNSALPAIWSTIGDKHNGCDCFVFPRNVYEKFDIGDICMGTPWSETTLITNMIAYTKRFIVFKQAHATFHIGDRRIWLGHEYNDYRIHNTNEFARILKKLSKDNPDILKHETILSQLRKLKLEVTSYTQMGEVYSEDCWDLIT